MIIEFILFYFSIMFAMCVDNIFWIGTSPEYNSFKKLSFFKKGEKSITIEMNTYFTKIDYIIKYRIWSVITHWRDITPALITSLILTLIWSIQW